MFPNLVSSFAFIFQLPCFSRFVSAACANGFPQAFPPWLFFSKLSARFRMHSSGIAAKYWGNTRNLFFARKQKLNMNSSQWLAGRVKTRRNTVLFKKDISQEDGRSRFSHDVHVPEQFRSAIRSLPDTSSQILSASQAARSDKTQAQTARKKTNPRCKQPADRKTLGKRMTKRKEHRYQAALSNCCQIDMSGTTEAERSCNRCPMAPPSAHSITLQDS